MKLYRRGTGHPVGELEEKKVSKMVYHVGRVHNHHDYDHNEDEGDIDEEDMWEDMSNGDNQDCNGDDMDGEDTFHEDEEVDEDDENYDINEDIEFQYKLNNTCYLQSQHHICLNEKDTDEEDKLLEYEEKEDDDRRIKTSWGCRGNNDLNCTCYMDKVEKVISIGVDAIRTKIHKLYGIVRIYTFYAYTLIKIPIIWSNLWMTLFSDSTSTTNQAGGAELDAYLEDTQNRELTDRHTHRVVAPQLNSKKELAIKQNSGGTAGKMMSLRIHYLSEDYVREKIVNFKKEDTILDVKRRFHSNFKFDSNTLIKREKEDALIFLAELLPDNATCHGLADGDDLYVRPRRNWDVNFFEEELTSKLKNSMVTIHIDYSSPWGYGFGKTLQIKRGTTILEVKRLLTNSINLGDTEYTLVYNNYLLNDDATLFDLGLEENIELTLNMKEENYEEEEEYIPSLNMENMKKTKTEKNRKKKEKKRKKKRITSEEEIEINRDNLSANEIVGGNDPCIKLETKAEQILVHENEIDFEVKDSHENIEKKGETDPQKQEDLPEVDLGTLGSEEDQYLFEVTNSVSNEIERQNCIERDLAFANVDDNYSFEGAYGEKSSIVEDIVTGGIPGDSAFNKLDNDADLTAQISEDVEKGEQLGEAAGAEQHSQDVQEDEQLSSGLETELFIQNSHEGEQLPQVTGTAKLCLGAHKTKQIGVNTSDAHIDRRKETEPQQENDIELRVSSEEKDTYLYEITQALSKRVEAELEVKKTKLETLQTEKVSLEKTLEKKLTLFNIHKDHVINIIDSKAKDMKNILVLLDKEEDEKIFKVKNISDIDSKLVELEAEMFAIKGEKNNLIIECEKADDQIKKFTEKKSKLENSISLELEKAKEEGIEIESAIQDLKQKLAENSRSLHSLPNEQINYPGVRTIEPNKQLLNFIDKQIGEKEKELECPVCFEIAIIPIFMCIESHLICSNCRPKIFECPECRLAYSGKPKKHRYAEKAAEELTGLKGERQELIKAAKK